MSIARNDLPVHAPVRRLALESAFASRVLGKREVARLSGLLADAEDRARARLKIAAREAEEIFAEARKEAAAILAMLPDFAALEAVRDGQGRSAYQIIRKVADRHGLPVSALTARQVRNQSSKEPEPTHARREAISAIATGCPHLSLEQIGALFGIRAARVGDILRGKP